MEQRQSRRVQQTRERLRATAHRLFLQHGYLATSIDAILAEAGISSKETFYRHYANKEALFVDVLAHLTMEQPGFSEKLAALPTPYNLPQLGTLFFSTVTQRGLTIMTDLLQEARQQQIIADVDFDAVTRVWLGGLLTYAITGLVFARENAQPPPLDRADAIVEVIMRALTPS